MKKKRPKFFKWALKPNFGNITFFIFAVLYSFNVASWTFMGSSGFSSQGFFMTFLALVGGYLFGGCGVYYFKFLYPMKIKWRG